MITSRLLAVILNPLFPLLRVWCRTRGGHTFTTHYQRQSNPDAPGVVLVETQQCSNCLSTHHD